METYFSETLGFFSLILGLFSLLLGLYCVWKTHKIGLFSKKLFAGKRGSDLEEIIMNLSQKLQNLERENLITSEEILKLKTALSFTVHKVGLVRYNPFSDGSGSYSFSLALLNSHNSGVIITNMYGRQQSRVYTKKITEGKSEIVLTEEEKQSITAANNETVQGAGAF